MPVHASAGAIAGDPPSVVPGAGDNHELGSTLGEAAAGCATDLGAQQRVSKRPEVAKRTFMDIDRFISPSVTRLASEQAGLTGR
jgi:hypothetical protein